MRELLGYLSLFVFVLAAAVLSRFRARAALRLVSRLSPLPALALMAFAASAPPAPHLFALALLLAGTGALAALARLR